MVTDKLVVGNWKMHLNIEQASLLVHRLDEKIALHRGVEVVLAPSYISLQPAHRAIDHRKFKLASQDGYFVDEGSYTGAVSFTMLRNLIDYAIIGHSERRRYFHESLEDVRSKVEAAVRNGIKPILCVGETRDERNQKETKSILHDQVVSALSNLTDEEVAKMVIGYEPVWAIGGHQPAKPAEIEEALQWIRYQVRELYGQSVADAIRLIYGGSDEPEFVDSIMKIAGVDGLLVGHASLNYAQMAAIIEGVAKAAHESIRHTSQSGGDDGR